MPYLQNVNRSSSKGLYQKWRLELEDRSTVDVLCHRRETQEETRVQHDGREEFLSLSQYIKYFIWIHETKEDIAKE